jgi:hypothetical protein
MHDVFWIAIASCGGLPNACQPTGFGRRSRRMFRRRHCFRIHIGDRMVAVQAVAPSGR